VIRGAIFSFCRNNEFNWKNWK